MIYKYSSHAKFIMLTILGLIASTQQIIFAYMVDIDQCWYAKKVWRFSTISSYCYWGVYRDIHCFADF